MAFSVYQHWDPLEVCVVGKSYPPEFYSWIQVPHVRQLFERIAIETEEDYQLIISKLQEFKVQIYRPDLPPMDQTSDKFVPPPMNPRDTMIMISDTFFVPGFHWQKFYSDIKDSAWPWYHSMDEFLNRAPAWQIQEARDCHRLDEFANKDYDDPCYKNILQIVRDQNTRIKQNLGGLVVGSMVSRIGKDLFFATEIYTQNHDHLLQTVQQEFPNNRNHVVNTGGHMDGTFCPVCPGLIISLEDVPSYANTFPDWEVVYLKGQSWDKVRPFIDLKLKNQGKWWIPGFEYDDQVTSVVETWMNHWTGYVEETVFDVNMLVIDPKNVLVFSENDKVFKALDRYGITPHVVPFRHRYFWDGGIHCVTLDLHRRGHQQDFFGNSGLGTGTHYGEIS